jgi:putative FmdB family regulatory protein
MLGDHACGARETVDGSGAQATLRFQPMPIYEFYCEPCHRVFSFLSRRIETTRVPGCPRCGAQALARRASSFAISKGRKEETAGGPDEMSDLDEGKLMKLMEELGPEAEKLDEENPRQAASMMRRVMSAAGLPVAGGMEEALRRMEAGEDPEKVEESLGDVLDADPFAAGPARAAGFKRLRRFLPPSVDTHLYEM